MVLRIVAKRSQYFESRNKVRLALFAENLEEEVLKPSRRDPVENVSGS